MSTRHDAEMALQDHETESKFVPGLKSYDGRSISVPPREAFNLGFHAGWAKRDQAHETRLGDESDLMARLVEARDNFATMTEAAKQLEEQLEQESTGKAEDALRIAYLEERVLQLQLQLRATAERTAPSEANQRFRATLADALGTTDTSSPGLITRLLRLADRRPHSPAGHRRGIGTSHAHLPRRAPGQDHPRLRPQP